VSCAGLVSEPARAMVAAVCAADDPDRGDCSCSSVEHCVFREQQPARRVAHTCPGLDELGRLLRRAGRERLTRAEVRRGLDLLEWQRGANAGLRAWVVDLYGRG